MLYLENAKKIGGWMSDAELLTLARLAQDSQSIIEVGSYQGRSTAVLADNIQYGGVVYAVDPWDCPNYNNNGQISFVTDDTTRHIFYCNLYQHIENGTVIMVPRKFIDVPLRTIHEPDVIFIDGDHRYQSVKDDIHHAIAFNPRFITGHDYAPEWPDVIKAVHEVIGKENIEVINSLWICKLR